MFNLPNWVYEPLPYLYVVLGIVTTYGLDTLLGKTSGIMLIVAGIIIAYMRHNYRRLLKIRMEREAWLKDQSVRRKRVKQVWLRDPAQLFREEMDCYNDDF